MKNVFYILFFLVASAAVWYVYPESPNFPNPPQGAVQSFEPADIESPLRRAYFTLLTREEVISHYQKELDYFPVIRLNYPPEDAQIYIRDQARSWYLEELVHPMRESVFVSGFIPQKAQDEIWHEGVNYYQKITIKYIPSASGARVVVAIAAVLASFVLASLVAGALVDLANVIYNNRT
ncbi:hypothetical protein C4564_04140 [Candidatus Microgenomates bacterium]|nr:MAG: hypothetical protein C4564_04140 [Candidatus Microgenomates bacterium]